MRLKVIACHVLRRELYACAARSSHLVDIVFLPQGLHDHPDRLREEVQREIFAPPMPPCGFFHTVTDGIVPAHRPFDAVLLGYGLCSNGTANLKAGDCPLVIPRAHDCVTLLLGSRQRYRDYFDRHPGTYWYSSGWIETSLMPGRERYEQTLAAFAERYGEDNAQFLMEMQSDWYKSYQRATYIDWKFPNTEEEKKYTQRCANELGWTYDELAGNNSLIQNMLNGIWPAGDFLVLQPGQTSAADPGQDSIIKIQDGNQAGT